MALEPDTDLYGQVLFQGSRFQRLRRYHRAAARHVDADLAVEQDGSWFAGYLPGELLLGDPGMRDALMHGNQVCVPDATLLPTGIDRVRPGGRTLDDLDEVRYCAAERSRTATPTSTTSRYAPRPASSSSAGRACVCRPSASRTAAVRGRHRCSARTWNGASPTWSAPMSRSSPNPATTSPTSPTTACTPPHPPPPPPRTAPRPPAR
ncbi:polyketide synthase dehydratase domain-containing protein [Nonomuraea rubra]|uniref:polyketide synthase dehydratase domain-containing protein n=1 Tax=Nonomuraea rubra TaxID=46180 RepID=UPI0036092855